MLSMKIHNLVTIGTALVFLTVSLGLVFLAVRMALKNNQKIQSRLAEAGGTSDGYDNNDSPKFLETFGNHLTLPGEDEIRRIRYQLAKSGYYHPAAVKIFFASRFLILLLPQIIILCIWGKLTHLLEPNTVFMLAAGLAIMSLYAPLYFLRWRKNRRILQARNGFPDLMDLLVASVEAGLGLDAALMRVSEELGARYPVLKINLDLMNRELRAGQTRHTAMVTFADRINLEEAKALAVILRQSEEMGSSLGAALRTFSEEMRSKRMLKAEEKAMALSAKLTVPLIVFIFPAIMVTLMLPSGIRIAAGL